jgi:hypothetical protein
MDGPTTTDMGHTIITGLGMDTDVGGKKLN